QPGSRLVLRSPVAGRRGHASAREPPAPVRQARSRRPSVSRLGSRRSCSVAWRARSSARRNSVGLHPATSCVAQPGHVFPPSAAGCPSATDIVERMEPGLVIVDKPAGMTSHDVVAKMRRAFGTRKVGHAGTLDPMATGVLVIGIERATKLLGHLTLDRKVYRATIALGAATTTDDAEGEVVSSAEPATVHEIDAERIDAEIAALTGDIMQVPSAVSAVKVDGKRAYARVRAGEKVELSARPVTVHRFELMD